MNFRRTWILKGPNFWARFPVVEAELELPASELPRVSTEFLDRLKTGFPNQYHDRLQLNAPLSEGLLHVVQCFQAGVGEPSQFGLVHATREPGFFRVVFAFEEEQLARESLEQAKAFCDMALSQQPFDVAAGLDKLKHIAHDVRLGPSTGAIVKSAQRRGIPIRRLNQGSLVQLGWGVRQHRIWTAETDHTTALGEAIAQDKELTRSLLYSIGVPVPWGRPVTTSDDAVAAAEEIGYPVVVKPQYGNQGRGVATNLRASEQILAAYDAARQESSYLMVEKYLPGDDYRLLIIGDRLSAAAFREPAHVVGDGVSTIRELVAEVNKDPRRSDGHATVLSFIKLDDIALGVLADQGLDANGIPPAGLKVLIRRNANLSTGGTATDVTEKVHPDVAAKAIDAARAVGLDIAGVDVVTPDISRPLDEVGGGIVEVNAGPGLRMHLEPSAGTPRPVGDAIVETLFRKGDSGRIPIIGVTGVNGKTTTTRLLAHLFRSAGKFVGMTCTDGIYLNGRRTETRDCSGPQSARQVLLHPRVELAILETARGGILREGLGFDWCDVAIVTNIGKGDHLGLRGIDTVEELARVKRVLVEAVFPQGTAVLNATDPLVAHMATSCPGRVLFFALDPNDPVVTAHRHSGGRAAFVRDGKLILAEGEHEDMVIELSNAPLAQGGRVAFQAENLLAATAAGWSLGLSIEALRTGLSTFSGSPEEVPGRFNVLEAKGGVVIVDYAHNPSAVAALTHGLDRFDEPDRTLVFSGCDRRDEDLIDMGKSAGMAFDRVILYADWGHGGRADGELNALLKQGLAQGTRIRETIETATEREAIEKALDLLGPGKLIVLGVEAIEDSLKFVKERLGTR